LDHGLHVLKPQSFPQNHAPKMRERHQFFFGLLWLVSKEFQHLAIQIKIEQDSMQTVSDLNKQEDGLIFA
jgi:hypothetical protein